MLTRIEIDGFKSFESFAVDLAPFVVVLGSNASGKSNLFDAIDLLSKLAGGGVSEAMKGMRGEPAELFRRTPGGRADRMQLAVELLIDPVVHDPWGNEISLTHTRLRYEIGLALRDTARGGSQVVVIHESAKPILNKCDPWVAAIKPSPAFRKRFLRYKRQNDFLSTKTEEDGLLFNVHHDGHQGRTRPAKAASASVLSTITNADFPHLFAVREELRNWRLLQLDPAMLRRPTPEGADDTLQPNGANLAAVLARIKQNTARDDQPSGALAAIAAELNALIPGVKSLDAGFDEASREYRARLVMRDGVPFSSRVISDGTLRVLALLTMLHDPRHRGVVCFEEPENGVHPGRLRDFVRTLRSMVTAPGDIETELDMPLSQLLLNSHSPVVLSALLSFEDSGQRQRVLLADMVSVVDPSSREVRRRSRIRPVHMSPQGRLIDFEDASDHDVSTYEVQQILETTAADA